MNRPHRTRIQGEQPIRDELRRRSMGWGSRKALANDVGVTPSFLCQLISGKRHMTPNIARQLGYKLVWVKEGE